MDTVNGKESRLQISNQISSTCLDTYALHISTNGMTPNVHAPGYSIGRKYKILDCVHVIDIYIYYADMKL